MKNIKSFFNKKLIYFIPLIVWMIVIFMFSAQGSQRSSELSESISSQIIGVDDEIVVGGFSIRFITVERIVRKAAHLAEYVILGILAMLAAVKNNLFIKESSIEKSSGSKSINDSIDTNIHGIYDGRKQIIIVIAFCVVYAISDEIHQAFVPGRSCRLFDMCLDTVGASIGVLVVWGILKCYRFRKEKSE